MDAAERDLLFARVVERARARRRPSKVTTNATFAAIVSRARRVRIGTRSGNPDRWSTIVERATRRSGANQT